jgi:predicted GNAT superfamily acetyltransferase
MFMKKIFSHVMIHEEFYSYSHIHGYKNMTRHKNMAYMIIRLKNDH